MPGLKPFTHNALHQLELHLVLTECKDASVQTLHICPCTFVHRYHNRIPLLPLPNQTPPPPSPSPCLKTQPHLHAQNVRKLQ